LPIASFKLLNFVVPMMGATVFAKLHATEIWAIETFFFFASSSTLFHYGKAVSPNQVDEKRPTCSLSLEFLYSWATTFGNYGRKESGIYDLRFMEESTCLFDFANFLDSKV
jgi:hypothetical protein